MKRKTFVAPCLPTLPRDFPCLKSRTAGGRKNPNRSAFSDFVEDDLKEGFLQMHKVTSALCLLLSQVFIPVLFPPQAAHGDKPNQVHSLLGRKRYYAPSLFRVLSPTLPGDFSCLHPALRAAGKILTKYNAAHWLE